VALDSCQRARFRYLPMPTGGPGGSPGLAWTWARPWCGTGWRAEQTSNAIELLTTSETSVGFAKTANPRCGGNFCRGTSTDLIQIEEHPGFEVRAAQEALVRARAMMEARMRIISLRNIHCNG
jgi:hypothetical protein